MPIHAQRLTTELARTHRVEFLPANPPDAPADGVNVWIDPTDRYPWTTVWAPIPGNPSSIEWVWGPSFQYEAPGETSLDELARRVRESIQFYLTDNPR